MEGEDIYKGLPEIQLLPKLTNDGSETAAAADRSVRTCYLTVEPLPNLQGQDVVIEGLDCMLHEMGDYCTWYKAFAQEKEEEEIPHLSEEVIKDILKFAKSRLKQEREQQQHVIAPQPDPVQMAQPPVPKKVDPMSVLVPAPQPDSIQPAQTNQFQLAQLDPASQPDLVPEKVDSMIPATQPTSIQPAQPDIVPEKVDPMIPATQPTSIQPAQTKPIQPAQLDPVQVEEDHMPVPVSAAPIADTPPSRKRIFSNAKDYIHNLKLSWKKWRKSE